MAKMTKSELFLRCLAKVLDEKVNNEDNDPKNKVTGENTGLVKKLKIAVQFNNQGEWTVSNLIFQSTLDPKTGIQNYKESVEVFPNIARKEEQKTVMELGSFLYELRQSEDDMDTMDSVRKEFKKQLLFGKREINAAMKEEAQKTEPEALSV